MFFKDRLEIRRIRIKREVVEQSGVHRLDKDKGLHKNL